MSKEIPSNDSLIHPTCYASIDNRISKMQIAYDKIESICQVYWNGKNGVQESIDQLRETSILNHQKWNEAFLKFACQLRASIIRDEARKQINAPLWLNSAAREGKVAFSLAGKSFCESLAIAIENDSVPNEFNSIQVRYKFVNTEDISNAISATLSHFESVLSDRLFEIISSDLKSALFGVDHNSIDQFRIEAEGFGLIFSKNAGETVREWEAYNAANEIRQFARVEGDKLPSYYTLDDEEQAVHYFPATFCELSRMFEELESAVIGRRSFDREESNGDAQVRKKRKRPNFEGIIYSLKVQIKTTCGYEELRDFTLKNWSLEPNRLVLNRIRGEMLRRHLIRTSSDIEQMRVEQVSMLLAESKVQPSDLVAKSTFSQRDYLTGGLDAHFLSGGKSVNMEKEINNMTDVEFVELCSKSLNVLQTVFFDFEDDRFRLKNVREAVEKVRVAINEVRSFATTRLDNLMTKYQIKNERGNWFSDFLSDICDNKAFGQGPNDERFIGIVSLRYQAVSALRECMRKDEDSGNREHAKSVQRTSNLEAQKNINELKASTSESITDRLIKAKSGEIEDIQNLRRILDDSNANLNEKLLAAENAGLIQIDRFSSVDLKKIFKVSDAAIRKTEWWKTRKAVKPKVNDRHRGGNKIYDENSPDE